MPRKGLEPCLTFYPTYDWELAFHIYIYREREREFTGKSKEGNLGIKGGRDSILMDIPRGNFGSNSRVRNILLENSRCVWYFGLMSSTGSVWIYNATSHCHYGVIISLLFGSIANQSVLSLIYFMISTNVNYYKMP